MGRTSTLSLISATPLLQVKGSTYQVRRADFDKLLAHQAQAQGVQIRYEEEIIQVDFSGEQPRLYVRRLKDGSQYQITCDFVLDASGYGRSVRHAYWI